MESLYGLKLKAGNFQHIVSFRFGFGDHGDHRSANVAAHQHILPGSFKNVAAEGGGGGLAVRTGDGDDVAAQEACGELDLADDWHPKLARLHQPRDIIRDAGADDDKVLI